MNNILQKSVIYRGRVYNPGEAITADPATLEAWQKNGIIAGMPIESTEDNMEAALRDSIARIESLEAVLIEKEDALQTAEATIKELAIELDSLKTHQVAASIARSDLIQAPAADGQSKAEAAEQTVEQPDVIEDSHDIGQTPQPEALSAPTPPGIVEGGSGAEGEMPGRDSRKKRG